MVNPAHASSRSALRPRLAFVPLRLLRIAAVAVQLAAPVLCLAGCGDDGGTTPPVVDASLQDGQAGSARDAESPVPDSGASSVVPGTSASTRATATNTVTSMLPTATVTVSGAQTAMPTVSAPPVNSSARIDDPPGDLEDCEGWRTSQFNNCSNEMRCGTTNYRSDCMPTSAGWSCSCYDYSRSLGYSFELTGATSENACDTAMLPCIESEAPAWEEGCEALTLSTAPSSCTAYEQCTSRAELDDGIEATVTWYGRAECQEAGGELNCTCENDESGYLGVWIYNSDTEAGCPLALQACHTAVPPDAPDECGGTVIGINPSGCNKSATCGSLITFDDEPDAYAIRQEFQRYSECTPYPDDTWECSCGDAKGGQTRTLSLPNAQLGDACDQVERFCASGTQFVPAGEIECTTQSVNASSGNCYAEDLCVQPGTLDGTSLGVASTVGVNCLQNNAGEWQCECHNAFSDSSYALSIEGNFTQVCQDAVQVCEARAIYVENESGYGRFIFGDVTPDAGVPDAATSNTVPTATAPGTATPDASPGPDSSLNSNL